MANDSFLLALVRAVRDRCAHEVEGLVVDDPVDDIKRLDPALLLEAARKQLKSTGEEHGQEEAVALRMETVARDLRLGTIRFVAIVWHHEDRPGPGVLALPRFDTSYGELLEAAEELETELRKKVQ